MGPFGQSDDFITKVFPISVNGHISKVFVSFIFFELDGWDGNGAGGIDTFEVDISGDMNDSIELGWFHHAFSDLDRSGTSFSGLIDWSMRSDSIDDSPSAIFTELPRSEAFSFA